MAGHASDEAAATARGDAAGERPTRVLALWCPDWPVLALGADPDEPVAVLATAGDTSGVPTGHVVACSYAARAAGVRRGQRLRDAQRRLPLLRALPRDQVREARVFEHVIAALVEFTPAVEVVRPGVCVFGCRGPARHAGGERRLAATVRDAVGALPAEVLGLPAGTALGCGVGVADGLFAALLAARADTVVEAGGSAAFLAPLPVTVLDEPDLTRTLGRLGIATLGGFAALPAGSVFERFGTAGTRAHRLASGLDPRPPAPRPPSVELSVRHVFDPPAGTTDEVLFAARGVAERLHAGLAAAGLGCARVGVELRTVGGRESARWWRHDGLLSAAGVAERVRWQLDGWRHVTTGAARAARSAGDTDGADGADGWDEPGLDTAGDGVAVLCLTPDQLVLSPGRQLDLLGGELVPDRVTRAVERVRGLSPVSGTDAVHRAVPSGGRGAAARIRRVPWDEPPRDARDGPEAGRWPGRVPDPQPAAVFDMPLPVELVDAAGRPVPTARERFAAPVAPAVLRRPGGRPDARVVAWAGPWPMHERWWDGQAPRAYLQCVTEDGDGWLLVARAGQWWIEGRY